MLFSIGARVTRRNRLRGGRRRRRVVVMAQGICRTKFRSVRAWIEGESLMCRIDCGEPNDVNLHEYRRARKKYNCGECGRSIAKGETYRLDKTLYDSSWSSWRTCSHCDAGREWLSRECGGWIFQEVREEIEEHALEYPIVAYSLLRFVVAARRQWKRFDDSGLMPVPAPLPSPNYIGAP